LVGSALLQCGQDNCPDEVGALGGGCLSCVVGNAEGGIGAIEAACLSDDATESYLYDCRYDTGILTSAEVVHQESLRLPSYLVAASVDYARVGGLDVFCTHLQSESSLAYQGDFDDWKDEQAHQIDALLAFIDDKNDGSRPVALLGDLNTGPGLPDIDGVWPEHYQRLLDAGLTNPFVAQDDVACTLCDDNTFRTPGSSNTLIDHVLLRGTSGQYRRMLTEPTTLPAGPSHHSDHYGLAADVASCAP
jgi:endonuclease/exonuclease/phosphatase family metal-dependent hydrolase